MIETIIDIAGISALTAGGGVAISKGLAWWAEHKNPRANMKMVVTPQVDGLRYDLICQTGRCGWNEYKHSLGDARIAMHDHLVGEHGQNRPLQDQYNNRGFS